MSILEEFIPYRNMVLYAILDAVELARKGDKESISWLNGQGLKNMIELSGTDLRVKTVLDLLVGDKGVKKRRECLLLDKEYNG